MQRLLKAVENGLHSLSDKATQGGGEGLTRPGAYIFEFLGQYNINTTTLPVLNTTIDVAINVVQDWQIDVTGSSSKMATVRQ